MVFFSPCNLFTLLPRAYSWNRKTANHTWMFLFNWLRNGSVSVKTFVPWNMHLSEKRLNININLQKFDLAEEGGVACHEGRHRVQDDMLLPLLHMKMVVVRISRQISHTITLKEKKQCLKLFYGLHLQHWDLIDIIHPSVPEARSRCSQKIAGEIHVHMEYLEI